MKRKILIGLGVFFGILVAFVGYRLATQRSLSPPATAAYSQGGLDVKVAYSKPSKRGRVIFGDKGAVVPYGKYWRLGANEATQITFNRKVSFGGKPVEAGTYRLYAVPGAQTWKLVLNSQLGKWGAFEADHAKDVLSVDVPAGTAAQPAEQLDIGFGGEGTNARMSVTWDRTNVQVPIAAL